MSCRETAAFREGAKPDIVYSMSRLERRKGFLAKQDPPSIGVGGLYMHVPFCRERCRYCDFCSATFDQSTASKVVAAECRELDVRDSLLRRPLDTAFVGGGTPTVLPPHLLRQVLSAVASRCDAQTEFTVEANPDSLTDPTLEALAENGVNRLSIGVQSFVNEEIMLLGRLHDSAQARLAIGRAFATGFADISVDLIYGIPGQTLSTWRQSIDCAVESGVTHMSCYCLSFEPGTPLAEDLACGRVIPMDEELQRECYYLAIDHLGRAGLHQYEISNFAMEGRQCRHNLTYWENRSYIGIGPSAASYVAGRRWTNSDNLLDYSAMVARSGEAVVFAEELTGRAAMAETIMLGLRLRQGIQREAFRQRFGLDAFEAFSGAMLRYRDMGMIRVFPDRIVLAPQALFVADAILADIIADAMP
jgi:oxygen-independent coproporphyrinogen-3 oxidase